ncbi:MAG: hypothetical protein QGG40_06650 [Myxococcota bacterium]|jgi:hypothetical protein|nr:hypothetical protein [Myxococcota bacterium]
MPTYDKPKKSSTTTASTESATTSQDTSTVTDEQSMALSLQEEQGNQAALAAIEAQATEDTAAALQNYEATLGSYLGPKLYGLVKEELSYAKMCRRADKVVESAMKKAAQRVGELDESADPAMVDRFGDAFAQEFEGVGCQWVQAEGNDLVEDVRGFALNNPEVVVGVAVLAAAGAYAADLEIPELAKTFDLNEELTLRTSLELGSLQNVALEKIAAQLKYESGNLSMTLDVGHQLDTDDTTVGLGLKYTF